MLRLGVVCLLGASALSAPGLLVGGALGATVESGTKVLIGDDLDELDVAHKVQVIGVRHVADADEEVGENLAELVGANGDVVGLLHEIKGGVVGLVHEGVDKVLGVGSDAPDLVFGVGLKDLALAASQKQRMVLVSVEGGLVLARLHNGIEHELLGVCVPSIDVQALEALAAGLLGIDGRGGEEDLGHAVQDVFVGRALLGCIDKQCLVQGKELLRAIDGDALVQQHVGLCEIGQAHAPKGADGGVAMRDEGDHLLCIFGRPVNGEQPLLLGRHVLMDSSVEVRHLWFPCPHLFHQGGGKAERGHVLERVGVRELCPRTLVVWGEGTEAFSLYSGNAGIVG